MLKLLGNLKKGLIFVVSAPAGTGKSTLVQMLEQEFPCVVESVSFTTRPPREGETQGIHYQFIGEKEFEKRIEQNEFLEYVKLYGHYYGTSGKWVKEQQDQGKHVVLVIDTQGGLHIRDKIEAVFVFIQPPSLEELRKRLTERNTEPSSVIEERLEWSAKEIAEGRSYDYQIINDDLNIAYQVLKSILIAEEHRSVLGLKGVTRG